MEYDRSVTSTSAVHCRETMVENDATKVRLDGSVDAQQRDAAHTFS